MGPEVIKQDKLDSEGQISTMSRAESRFVLMCIYMCVHINACGCLGI